MNWQVPAAGAALGFVFSLLGGLLGGIGFLDLVLRGFLGALVMGGLTGGLQFLLVKFLPELFEGNPEGRSEDGMQPGPEGPSQVDITLGEDGEGAVLSDSPEEPSPFSTRERSAEGSQELPSFGSQIDDMGDELPDVGGLSPMESGSREAPALETQSETPEPSGSGTVEFEGQQEDPAILARAVQTVMKREGEK